MERSDQAVWHFGRGRAHPACVEGCRRGQGRRRVLDRAASVGLVHGHDLVAIERDDADRATNAHRDLPVHAHNLASGADDARTRACLATWADGNHSHALANGEPASRQPNRRPRGRQRVERRRGRGLEACDPRWQRQRRACLHRRMGRGGRRTEQQLTAGELFGIDSRLPQPCAQLIGQIKVAGTPRGRPLRRHRAQPPRSILVARQLDRPRRLAPRPRRSLVWIDADGAKLRTEGVRSHVLLRPPRPPPRGELRLHLGSRPSCRSRPLLCYLLLLLCLLCMCTVGRVTRDGRLLCHLLLLLCLVLVVLLVVVLLALRPPQRLTVQPRQLRLGHLALLLSAPRLLDRVALPARLLQHPSRTALRLLSHCDCLAQCVEFGLAFCLEARAALATRAHSFQQPLTAALGEFAPLVAHGLLTLTCLRSRSRGGAERLRTARRRCAPEVRSVAADNGMALQAWEVDVQADACQRRICCRPADLAALAVLEDLV